MKRSRYTEVQIIGILKEHDGGLKTAEFAASMGFRRRPSTSTS